MAIGFNADVYEKTREEKKLVNSWIVIHYPNHIFIGKVKKINEDEVVLSPYRGFDYDYEGKHIITILEKELTINLNQKVGIEKVTKEWVENRIKAENLDLKKDKKNHIKK